MFLIYASSNAQKCDQKYLDDINARGIPTANIDSYEKCAVHLETDYYNCRNKNIDENFFSKNEKDTKNNIANLTASINSLNSNRNHNRDMAMKDSINRLLDAQYQLLNQILNGYKTTLHNSFQKLIDFYKNVADKDGIAKKYQEKLNKLEQQ